MARSASDSQPVEAQSYWRRNMWTGFAACGVANIGYSGFYPFLPLIVREMGFTENLEFWVGMLAWMYFGTSLLFTPIWGVMADHFGERSQLLRAGFGMAIGFFLLPFAPTLLWLIPPFLLVGACNGFIPACVALQAAGTPIRRMGSALSIIQIGAQAGNIIGPLAGAFLASRLPAYRYLFWIPAAGLFTAGALALLLMREVKRKVSGPFRMHLIQDAARLSRVPGMRPLLLLVFLFHFTVYGSTPVASIFTMQLLEGGAPAGGLSVEGWVGAVAMTIYISSLVSLPVWGWLLDRYDPPRMLALVAATAFVGSLPLVFVQTPLQLAAARLFFGMCAAGMQPAVMRMIKLNAPPGMDSRALYFGTMFQMLGNGLGPLAAGVIGPFFGLRSFFMLNAALLGAGLGTWLLRLRRMTG